jgi:predicted neuraminidase
VNRSIILFALLWASPLWGAEQPFIESELIFPLGTLHSHSSSVVQLPNGDFYACWYKGSGESSADDVKVDAALLRRNSRTWSTPYTLVDQPDFPDMNPVLFMDSHQRLWVIWSTILAHRGVTGLLRYKIASHYPDLTAPPPWDVSDPLLFIPRNFAAAVKRDTEPWPSQLPDGHGGEKATHVMQLASDEYFSRMGWMGRNQPLELPSGRILLPIYSDGYSFSILAITDDGGKTWASSEPIVSMGGVQPSLVRKRDGTIVAYMRNNGPPPKRVIRAESRDDGITWSTPTYTDIPNPGSSMEVTGLRDGLWVMVGNDTEHDRNSLLVAISDDEGLTWKWRRHLERDTSGKNPGRFHYPTLIQARDGSLHATYSYTPSGLNPGERWQSIKHVHFNVEWVKQGE